MVVVYKGRENQIGDPGKQYQGYDFKLFLTIGELAGKSRDSFEVEIGISRKGQRFILRSRCVAKNKRSEHKVAVAVDADKSNATSGIEGSEERLDELEPSPVGFKSETRHKTYSVQMVLQMYRQGQFRLPSFQRKFVWSRKRRQGFLESLVLGVPMMSLMVAVDTETHDRYILDGFQRIHTMDMFLNDKERMGPNITELAKKKYSMLPREIQNKILNTEFVVIEVESERKFWPYTFGQINKGGVSLNPTEIRRATFNHKTLMVLDDFTETRPYWIEVFGKNFRYRGLQAALRALAMHDRYEDYQKPINKFMNDFCTDRLGEFDADEVLLQYEKIVEALCETTGTMSFRVVGGRGVNLGLIDCMIHAGLSILEGKWDVETEVLGEKLSKIREVLVSEHKERFKGDTSHPDSVMTRMSITNGLVESALAELQSDN